MNGKEFIKTFKDEFKHDKVIKENYNPPKDLGNKLSDYTKLMAKLIKRVLIRVNGVDFDKSEKHLTDNYYTYNPEYFKIDYTSWNNNKIEPYSDTGIKLYSWNFDFAIEHENDTKDWTYEVLKLSFIRADVRIVIGYVDREKCKDEIEVIKAQVKEFKHKVEDNEEYYVILMNTKLNNDDPGMKVYQITKDDVIATEV